MAPEHNNFGLIRLALALAVLVSHAYYLSTGAVAAEPLVGWTGHSLGEHAVQIFFFLSGIMVAQSLERCLEHSLDRSGGLLNFAIGRALRIFPGLIVCVVLTAFALGPLVSRLDAASYFGDAAFIAYIWKTLSLATGLAPLPGVFDGLPAAGTVNMSLWTLKYEVLCYAGLAIAAAAGLMAPHRRALATAALAVFITVIFLEMPDAQYSTSENMRYFALFFATGVLAYLARDHLPLRGAALLLLGLVFAAALGTRFGELATALFLGYAALMSAALPIGGLRALTNRYDLSFGVYIYACPLQQLAVQFVPGWSNEAQILIVTAAVLPVALLSWLLVERPALRQRAKLARGTQTLLSRRRMLAAR